MRFPIFLPLFIIFFDAVQAQNTGSLTGSVKDKLTQEPLIGVSIKVEGAEIGTSTDVEGNFRIWGIPPKTYNEVAPYVGYAAQTKFLVVITTGNANELNFELEPDGKTLG